MRVAPDIHHRAKEDVGKRPGKGNVEPDPAKGTDWADLKPRQQKVLPVRCQTQGMAHQNPPMVPALWWFARKHDIHVCA